MAEQKTKKTRASVAAFIQSVPNEQRRKDAAVLVKLFAEVTGQKPTMWGPAIIGFNKYHFKSTRSRQQGDWPMVAFSPRKQSLTLYVIIPPPHLAPLLKQLGKHSTSVACLYINRLSDVRLPVLKKIVRVAYQYMLKKYGQPTD